MSFRTARVVCASFAVCLFFQTAYGAVDPELLAGMQARSIGPAGMSGRVAAIDAVQADPDVVYVGAATGGLWKSTNGGLTWRPLFDEQPVAAVGAVAIFQPAPDTVWVGTGEGNPRNSVSVGNGIYRSLDGGETWAHLGLEDSERIHRIVLHPADPDVAYVAAMGRAWGENEQRGVFKTDDGGKTWRSVLFVDERTGAADLVMDPSNPRKLFAAMWQYRRWPWFFESGGPGSGLYVTLDGGETWKRLTPEDGLPEGDLGRIGVAVSRSDPRTVYALIEAEENGLYVSRDGGRNWKLAGKGRRVGNRPFYYADIRVDPERPDTVYSLWSMISVSRDGGKNFEILVPFRAIHPDHHAMWINPADAERMIIGNDGGVAFSADRGETWRFVDNLPLAQYYHVHVDMENPYNVYGGMQDNGSWRGPSSVRENGGIRNHHWEEVGFGDGFDTLPHPRDPQTGYSMSQEGYLRRWDLRTGRRKDIRPPAPDGVELRFNWNAAIAIDPFAADTLYYGSQFVHVSFDRGETWDIISGDLTSNDPQRQRQKESGGLTPDVTGAENFTTITTIAPSPVEPGVIWVGTDDGRIHVTRDGGERWTRVDGGLRGVPDGTWVPHIEPSVFDVATAYVVLDDHRRSNWTPYVFRTTDYGRSWKNLATDELRGYCLVIEQDPVDRNLLFLGTEFGLYFSVDGGRRWMPFRHGFPTVAARDLVVHPRDHDLVIGTHGRAAYVVDDIAPLRGLSAATMEEPLRLFDIPDAEQYVVKQTGASRFPGHGEFRGENRPYGALITYSLNVEGLPHPEEKAERERKARRREAAREEEGSSGEESEEEPDPGTKDEGKQPRVEIRVEDESGRSIRELEGPARLGINRTAWDLRRDSFKEPPREGPRWFEPRGPEVLPGNYVVTVKYGDHEAGATVVVRSDPRVSIPQADRERKWEALVQAGELQELVAEAVRRLDETRSDIDVILAKATHADEIWKEGRRDDEDTPNKELIESGTRLKRALDEVETRFWRPTRTKGIVADDDALSKISYAMRNLGSSWDAPTPAQESYLHTARSVLDSTLREFNRLFEEDVAAFRRSARGAGFSLLPAAASLELR